MINFSENAVYNLKPIDTDSVIEEVQGLLVQDEELIQAFQTMRDQFIFTNKRIIAIDVKGITGKKKELKMYMRTNIPCADFEVVVKNGVVVKMLLGQG